MLWMCLYFLCCGLLLALPLTAGVRALALRWGIRDRGAGAARREAVPLLGGVAILLACYLTVGLHLGLHAWLPHLPGLTAYLPHPMQVLLRIHPQGLGSLLVLLGGGFAVFLIGLYADYRGLDIRVRLLGEAAVAITVVALGVRPQLLWISPVLAGLVTVIWIVAATNAFNLIDGLDGLAGSVALASSLVLAIFCLLTRQYMVAFLLCLIAGSVIGFLRANWHPARIYLGNAGALFLGYMLATIPLEVAFMHPESTAAAVAIPVLILAVPLYDTVSVFAIRTWHRRSIFTPDRNHIGHRLRRLGLSVSQTATVVALLTFAVGISTLLLLYADSGELVLILLHLTAMFAVLIVIESRGVQLRRRRPLLDIAARFALLPPTKPPAASAAAGTGTLRSLHAEKAELEIRTADLAAFARALVQESRLSLDMESPFDPEPITFQARVESVWQVDAQRSFAGLAFVHRDENALRHARATVAALLYPVEKENDDGRGL